MKNQKAAFSAATNLPIDNTTLLQVSKVSMGKINDYIQTSSIQWGNIPKELMVQPRWVHIINGTPIRNWSNLNQQTLPNTKKVMAFDISSHSKDHPNYLLLDWDNVYDPATNTFTSELAESLFYWVLTSLPPTYVELSKSKHGFHMVVEPNPDTIPVITNSMINIVKFTENSKLEMFYKNKAHLALLTGYSLGESVIAAQCDEFISELLEETHKYNNYKQPNRESIRLFTFEQDQIRAKKMLEYIPVTKLSRTEWREVIRCWKDLQLPYVDIDNWSQNDSRYNDGKDADMDITWENMEDGDPLIAIKTLCNYAEKYGQYNSIHHWDGKFWKQFQYEILTEGNCTETIQTYIQSPGDISEQVLKAIAYLIITNPSTPLILQFKAAAKTTGINSTELTTQIKPYQESVKQMLIARQLRQKQNTSEKQFKKLNVNCPFDLNKFTFPNNLVPNWENKTLEQVDTETIEKFKSIALITESLYDPNSKIYYATLQILSHLDDEWNTVTVPRSYLTSSKLVELSNKGLAVSQWNCEQVSKYLIDFEQLNIKSILKKIIAYQPGWENDEFICPQIPSKNCGLTSTMIHALNKDFSVSGNISESIKMIEKLKHIPTANFALGTILASPLVGIIGCENIHVHIYGNSGSGKSSLFKAIFSIMGNPNAVGSIPTSKTSSAGLEFHMATRRDLPAMIDDLNTANNEEIKPILHDLIMGYGNGLGKMRGNVNLVLNHTYQMRGALLTNSENMITTDFSNGGSKRRVIELCLENQIIDATLGEEIANITKQNYGLFFVDWITYLQNNQSIVKNTFQKHFNWLKSHYPEKTERQLHYVATVITANQLFSKLFLDSEESTDNYTDILSQLTDVEIISDSYRIQRMIQDWFVQNKHMFVPDTHVPTTPHWGFISDNYVMIYPQIFNELIKSWGFHVNTVKKQLRNDGFIQKSSGNNLNTSYTLGDNTNIRLVKIYANKLT